MKPNLEKKSIRLFFIALLILVNGCKSPPPHHVLLEKQVWIHGSENCATNTDPPIQVIQYDEDTWILRQNKCIHYEAPFMFLFVGQDKALLVDTGATEDENTFPLFSTVSNLISDWQKAHHKTIPLVVAHSHSHHDHHAGDVQFNRKPNITVIGLEVEDIKKFFGIEDWPADNASFDLGKRTIEIIPIPGHQKSSIAFYDHSSELLLTGDTFYPGRLYVEDWMAFKVSVAKLLKFANGHAISYILGNHIEMSSYPGVDYLMGATFQPHEQRLPLTIKDLETLQLALAKLGFAPTREVFDKFIVYPK